MSETVELQDDPSSAQVRSQWVLCVAWSAAEAARVGEVAFVGRAAVLGRGAPRTDDPHPRLTFVRQRPGRAEPTGPLLDRRLSRVQLVVEPIREGISVHSVGRRALRVRGREVERATLRAGDVATIDRTLVLSCERRPVRLPDAPRPGTFGEPDESGWVGESVEAWRVRRELAFAAPRPAHVLLLGPSGTGKELAAQALHDGSGRSGRPLVAVNAAALPEGLVDAELFGHVRDYPNPGMPARAGLIGEADGSTLFLDEIGELPAALQAHLLRVLDRDGSYRRLGEGRERRADLRVVAATNRPLEALKHDLAARFSLQVRLPGLPERVSDIPLIARALLRRIAGHDPQLAERFFDDDGLPRLAPELVEALLRHRYETHVRELGALLWRSLGSSDGPVLLRTEAVDSLLRFPLAEVSTAQVDATDLQAALAAAGGNRSEAARSLGISRDQLYRLLSKHGLR